MNIARSPALFAMLAMLHASDVLAQRSAPRDYPIIDMHLHAMRANSFGPPPQPICMGQMTLLGWDPAQSLNPGTLTACNQPVPSAETDDQLMRRTLAILERENIIGVTSGPGLRDWRAAAPERLIPGLLTAFGNLTPDSLRALLRSGEVRVLGEITTQYRGLSPAAPELDAYWSVAEEFDVPVGIHMGSGPPGIPMIGARTYRAASGRPLHLEEVLSRHPRLRVYVMHAGYPYIDELISLLLLYPQVYVDVGVIGWATPRPAFHQYLMRLVEAGLAQRVMFGSDQMVWPEAIEVTIQAIETAEFLTPTQKRDIYYENARRFLRLDATVGAAK